MTYRNHEFASVHIVQFLDNHPDVTSSGWLAWKHQLTIQLTVPPKVTSTHSRHPNLTVHAIWLSTSLLAESLPWEAWAVPPKSQGTRCGPARSQFQPADPCPVVSASVVDPAQSEQARCQRNVIIEGNSTIGTSRIAAQSDNGGLTGQSAQAGCQYNFDHGG